MRRNMEIFTNNLVKDNPVLRLVLGICPVLPLTKWVQPSLFLGLIITFILIISNIFSDLLRKVVPIQGRIPVYVLILAGLTSIIDLLLQAYFPEIQASLGIYLSMSVAVCMILGKPHSIQREKSLFYTSLDGFFIGLSFTITVTLMATIREILGFGTFFNKTLFSEEIQPFTLMVTPVGGFFVFSFLLALVSAISTPNTHST